MGTPTTSGYHHPMGGPVGSGGDPIAGLLTGDRTDVAILADTIEAAHARADAGTGPDVTIETEYLRFGDLTYNVGASVLPYVLSKKSDSASSKSVLLITEPGWYRLFMWITCTAATDFLVLTPGRSIHYPTTGPQAIAVPQEFRVATTGEVAVKIDAFTGPSSGHAAIDAAFITRVGP